MKDGAPFGLAAICENGRRPGTEECVRTFAMCRPCLLPAASVAMTVPATCHVTAAALTFGNEGLSETNVDALSTIGVQISKEVPYAVALDGGRSASTDPTQRKMSMGREEVTYGLYRDAARSLSRGSMGGADTASGVGDTTVQSFAVYGRVPAQTLGSPGLYMDTVFVTVSY
jgi:spore coat protein U-like protein